MKQFLEIVRKLDVSFHALAGVMLALMMLVTLTDVIMRAAGHPIVGTIEIITFSGAMVVGFALPYSSWKNSHVNVDFLTEKLHPTPRRLLEAVTKVMGTVLFLFIAYNFILYGQDLKRTGEVSPAFKIPYYPLTYALSFSCLMQSLTLFCDICRKFGGGSER
jgi:TRAP-type C4-dicarboxylate transport system permease small subunit